MFPCECWGTSIIGGHDHCPFHFAFAKNFKVLGQSIRGASVPEEGLRGDSTSCGVARVYIEYTLGQAQERSDGHVRKNDKASKVTTILWAIFVDARQGLFHYSSRPPDGSPPVSSTLGWIVGGIRGGSLPNTLGTPMGFLLRHAGGPSQKCRAFSLENGMGQKSPSTLLCGYQGKQIYHRHATAGAGQTS